MYSCTLSHISIRPINVSPRTTSPLLFLSLLPKSPKILFKCRKKDLKNPRPRKPLHNINYLTAPGPRKLWPTEVTVTTPGVAAATGDTWAAEGPATALPSMTPPPCPPPAPSTPCMPGRPEEGAPTAQGGARASRNTTCSWTPSGKFCASTSAYQCSWRF